MGNNIGNILHNAHKALDAANKAFPSKMASAIVTPPAQKPTTDYSAAHAARKSGGSETSVPMGPSKSELDTALQEHARNEGAAHQQ